MFLIFSRLYNSTFLCFCQGVLDSIYVCKMANFGVVLVVFVVFC